MSCGIARIGVGRYAGFTPVTSDKPGTVTTRPIDVDFNRDLSLQLNVKAGAKGQAVRVAVVDAVRQGQFHIWAINNVDDGLEVLTGKHAEAIHGAAKRRLKELALTLKEFDDS